MKAYISDIDLLVQECGLTVGFVDAAGTDAMHEQVRELCSTKVVNKVFRSVHTGPTWDTLKGLLYDGRGDGYDWARY